MEVRPDPGTGDGAPAPTCYRHPGRQTYLSCVRCGRSACPDCLRPAPVGHQCVECIKSGSKESRQPTGAFGGRVAAGATATWILVGLNVLLYIVEWVSPQIFNLEMQGIQVAHGQYYRLLTSAFLHYPGFSGIGPAHIIFNMWALIVIGPPVERVLGHLRFVVVYLLSAIGGSVLFYLLASPRTLALGASGAIFGLFGAWLVLARRNRWDSRWIMAIIGINLVLDFVLPDIAWQAHIGGLITGGLLTAAYAYAPRQRRGLVQAGATAAMVVLIIVAVVARNATLLGA